MSEFISKDQRTCPNEEALKKTILSFLLLSRPYDTQIPLRFNKTDIGPQFSNHFVSVKKLFI